MLWNLFNQSHGIHIMSLVIDSLGPGTHTHTHTHMDTNFMDKSKFKNQAHAGLWLMCLAKGQHAPGL